MTVNQLTRRGHGIVATMAILASGVIGVWAAAPAAMASPLPPAGGSDGSHAVAPVRIVFANGMPVWQIALIAIAAALVASIAAVALDRARSARRQTAPQVS